MTNLDVRKNYNQNEVTLTNSQVNATQNTNSPSNITMVDENALANNTDSYSQTSTNNSNTSNSSSEYKRSEEEVYNVFKGTCNKYGISKQDLTTLLNEITKVDIDRLRKMKSGALINIDQCLSHALEKLNYKSGNVNLREVSDLAHQYSIGSYTGLTFDEVDEELKCDKHQSLMDYLRSEYPDLIESGDIEKALENYFNKQKEEVLKLLANETDEYKRQEIIKNYSREQLRDFGRLLLHTPDEDKAIIVGAIKHLTAENRLEGFDVLVRSISSNRIRNEVARCMTPEQIEELQRYEDIFGKIMRGEDISGLVKITTENLTKEDLIKFCDELKKKAKTFFKENNEIILRIYAKQRSGEPLTDEELAVKEKIDNFFTPATTGEILGTAENKNITDDFRNDFLKALNEEAYKYENYRDVINAVREYYEQHSDEFSMNKEDFESLMNEATNNNYTIIKNDKENNTETKLNEPVKNNNSTEDKDKKEQKTNNELGYNNTSSCDNTKLDKIKDNILNTSDNAVKETKRFRSDYEIASENYGTLENAVAKGAKTRDLKVMAKHNGTSKTELVTMIFNESKSEGVINFALNLFKNFVPSMKEKTYINVTNNDYQNMLAKELTYTQREKLQGIGSYSDTQKLKKMNEEMEESNKNLKHGI